MTTQNTSSGTGTQGAVGDINSPPGVSLTQKDCASSELVTVQDSGVKLGEESAQDMRNESPSAAGGGSSASQSGVIPNPDDTSANSVKSQRELDIHDEQEGGIQETNSRPPATESNNESLGVTVSDNTDSKSGTILSPDVTPAICKPIKHHEGQTETDSAACSRAPCGPAQSSEASKSNETDQSRCKQDLQKNYISTSGENVTAIVQHQDDKTTSRPNALSSPATCEPAQTIGASKSNETDQSRCKQEFHNLRLDTSRDSEITSRPKEAPTGPQRDVKKEDEFVHGNPLSTSQPVTQQPQTTNCPETILKRAISITVCSSAQEFSVKKFIEYLRHMQTKNPDLIKNVRYLQLPYNNIQNFRFADHVDVMVLCHSINNRRFAITDVMDALYDDFLYYCDRVIGKKKIALIAHDFGDFSDKVNESRMSSFRHRQATTFQTTSLALTCGKLETKLEIITEDLHRLNHFFENARMEAEEMKRDSMAFTKRISSFFQDTLLGNGKGRPISIHVCTTGDRQSVQGLIHLLDNMNVHMPELRIKELKFCKLPHTVNELDSFRFPDEEAVDVMLLCHSLENVASALTDVGALYDKFLPYCQNAIGEKKIAVILHDCTVDLKSRAKFISTMPGSSTPLDIMCGKLSPIIEIESREKHKLMKFLTEASFMSFKSESSFKSAKSKIKSIGNFVSSKFASLQSGETSGVSTAKRLRRGLEPVRIAICSSSYDRNVAGFLSELRKLKQQHPDVNAEICFKELPYNDIDGFRFHEPIDVMILCHSINNRGFSITDVDGAIYYKYLKYCHEQIGRQNVVVIVHDFKEDVLQAEMNRARMGAFRARQPSTATFAGTVILCHKLDAELKMRQDDWQAIVNVFNRATAIR